MELGRVERVITWGAPPLGGESRSCGGMVAVEPGRRQVAELRVGLLLVEPGGPHRGREHLEDIRALVARRGRCPVPQLLAGARPVVLAVAIDVVELPPVPLEQFAPRRGRRPAVAGSIR